VGIKTIPLTRLEADLRATLDECVNSGEPVVVEMPGHRMIAIQPLECSSDDSLMDDLLQSNSAFRDKVARSKAGPRKPFAPGGSG
jgi:hypothetical protein